MYGPIMVVVHRHSAKNKKNLDEFARAKNQPTHVITMVVSKMDCFFEPLKLHTDNSNAKDRGLDHVGNLVYFVMVDGE